MAEFIVHIPGPVFLIFFSVLSVMCIIMAKILIARDGYENLPVPEPSQFEPTAIASLRGGWGAVIRVTLFNLWERKMIEITGSGIETRIKSAGTGDHSNAIEAIILKILTEPKKPSDLFKDKSLIAAVESHLRTVNMKFEKIHLIRTTDDKKRAWVITLSAFCIFMLIGIFKTYMGIMRDKPVVFLVLLMVLFTVINLVVQKPWKSITGLGNKFIKKARENYESMKGEISRGIIPDGANPAMAVAVFGVGILAGSALFAAYSSAFPADRSGNGNYGCSGGCGSGCSSGCSGGGGCGGGGCGGCGGD
jgi:uncharacterized protein (TIGR04222 family)